MAKAGRKLTPKRTSRRPSKTEPSPWLSLEEVFQRWRTRFGSSEDATDELEDFLRHRGTRSAKHKVDASGEEIPGTNGWVDTEFWRDRLSVVPDADGVADHLAVDYTDYADIYLPDGHWEFYVRALDVERWERLWGGNNVSSDYDPIAEFEREIEGRPRTPLRLYPMTAAPTSAPKKKRRKAKQPSRAGHPAAPPSTAAAPVVSEVATQDVPPEVQGVEPFKTGAGGRPSAITVVLPEAKRMIDDGEVEVVRGKQEEFADALADWWEEERKKHNPPGPKITGKTIRNSEDFRSLWRQALAEKSQNPPSENPETN
jgi:hypothetical protein